MADYMTPKIRTQQQLDIETLKEHANKQREPAVWPREEIAQAQAGEKTSGPSEVTGGPVPGPEQVAEWYETGKITNTTNTKEGVVRGENPLEQWWRANTESEIAWLVPKAEEYGGMHRASDLVDLGRTMTELMGRDPGEYSEGALQELGIYFYLEGKLGRWKAAILENRGVSEDTLTDISVYARMALRARQAGGWPV